MSITLDPVVTNKLRHFSRRRMWLIVARGICAGIVTFLLCTTIVAAIDWYWLLSDQTRWGLSAGIYLPVLIVVWMTCVRKMMHLPAQEELASQVELSEPQLRENLLSAVELATDDPSVLHDSPVFRSLLQGKVAEQMGRIQVPRLLPVKLVAKWLLAAVVIVAIAAALLLSGDGRFRQLAARAILPGANIARVSRVNVEILQPTPHSLLLAEDETVAIVVEVTGGSFDKVTLETFTEKQGTARQSMKGRTDVEFTSNIHVMNETVEYRIMAGDAVTERFRIESRPRPRVTAFHKTYEYPEYSLLPPETVTETHGDLLILEGTKTLLKLELDQQVSAAELRIDPADSEELTVIPLTPDPESTNGLQWIATVPVDKAAIYKVHLVSKETGFENIFSPKYEIRPQPDLIPRAGFIDQQETTLLLPPNDIVALKAMAEDDLPLVSLEQLVSINGRDWIALPLDAKTGDEKDGRHLTADWHWDLLSHKLKTGDQVITKLVATDRKGNIGESIPLRIIVASSDFDPQRHTILERKVGLYDELAKFSALLQEHKTSALEAIDRLRKPETSDEQKTLDRAALADLANKQREQATELLAEVKAVAIEMPAGADAYDLDLTGRVIARIQREHANVPAFALKAMLHTEDANRVNGDLDVLKQTFERSADDAKLTAEHYQNSMAYNFMSGVAFDLDTLLTQQQFVVGSSTQTFDRLQRQETVAVNLMKDIERLLRDQRRRMPNYLEGHINNLLTWSTSQRERLQDSMESEEKLDQLKNVSVDFLNQLKNQQRFDAVDGGLPGRVVNAWRDLDNRAGNLFIPIEQTANAVRQENEFAVKAANSADSAESRKLLDQAERFVAEVDLKQRSMDQLRSRRELTQSRKDADAQYAADAGLTHRAVTSLMNQHRQLSPQESPIEASLREIAPAYRTLEAGHDLTIARDALNNLLTMERWNSQGVQSHMDHPRQWDLVQRGFELASQRLREAGVKNELVGPLDQIRWDTPVRDAGRKITERRWRRDLMTSAGHELVQIREALTKVMEDIEPVMQDARNVIARFSPTIPQMAQQTADQLREMEEATTETADTVEKEDAAQQPDAADAEKENTLAEAATAEQKLAELEQQQQAINEQITDLMEALVEDANAQNMLEESERERARDADDSIAMIQEPATEMNRAMEKAQETSDNEQQAKDLAQAAEQQEKTAKALELVAEHFDKLEEGLDVAETRAELRQAERDLGIARQMDQQYEGAEELADQASQEAQELMAELEAELQQNPAMQKALSELSQNALQDAQDALEYAAQDDQSIQQQNERADEDFQAKKRELAEDLREMGQEASRLSSALVAQANQSAAQGKTPEAQQKFAETQQKLNEAAAKANSAREEQLLPELAQTAQEAKAAVAEATEVLKQAKQQADTGKDAQVHADDKAREAQKKDSENRRKQFQEQEKRTARDLAKRAEDAKKRAEQAVQNAEKAASAADKRVEQAQEKSNKKPDDAGLKNNVAQEQVRQAAEQKKVAAAMDALQTADQNLQQQNQQVEAVNNRPMPSLDAANPATQLASQYAEEAVKVAEALSQKAQQLEAAAHFDNELSPTQGQLASAQQQQHEVTQDVANAAQDVARAARHERRLNNAEVAEPLQNAANNIQQVAQNESTNAEQQLNEATAEAKQGEADAQANPQNSQPQPNGQALEAQQGLETSEKAIAQQADQLNGVVEPLLAAAAAEANQESEQGDPNAAQANGEPGQTPPGQTPAGQNPPANGQSQNGEPANGESASGEPASGQPAAPSFTPEQLARGQQLARTLDELDRQVAVAATNASQPGQQTPPTPSRLDALAQAAKAQQAAQAAARQQAQQEAAMALNEGGHQSSDSAPEGPQNAKFGVIAVNRNEATDWGKLRNKSAEDLTKGKSEAVSEEYRKSVEAYFKVLAERAKKK